MSLRDYLVSIPGALNDTPGRFIPPPLPLDILREKDPWELYKRQLLDYFAKKYNDAVASGENPDEVWSKIILDAESKDSYQSIFNEASSRHAFGNPVQTMPLYKEVRNIVGNNVKELYLTESEKETAQREKLIDSLQQGVYSKRGKVALDQAVKAGIITSREAFDDNPYYQDVLQTEQAGGTTRKQQLQRGAYSQAGRVALQQAVAAGEITSEEAYTNNPYWQDYSQSEVAKGQEKQAAEAEQKRLAIAKGRVTPEGRRMLIEQGLVGQGGFFTPGSPEAQALESETALAARKVNRNTDAVRILENEIRQAKQAGIDTSKAEQVYQQHAFGGGNDAPLNMAAQQLRNITNQKRVGAMESEAQMLAAEYPDMYKDWTTKEEAGGTRPSMLGFYTRIKQPDFQQKIAAEQSKMFTEYGDLYGSYRDYLSKATEYKPFETWAIETPENKTLYEQIRKRNLLRDVRTSSTRPFVMR